MIIALGLLCSFFSSAMVFGKGYKILPKKELHGGVGKSTHELCDCDPEGKPEQVLNLLRCEWQGVALRPTFFHREVV